MASRGIRGWAALGLLWGGLVLAGEGERLYAIHCARCHGEDRLGGSGPALLAETLKHKDLMGIIQKGLPASQMPGFGGVLGEEALASLVAFLKTPVPVSRWGMAQIRASRIVHAPPGEPGDKPVFKADPLNLFLVVEKGDHHLTVLDGDRFESIARLPTRPRLHGGPKFSPDGRFVFLASRDGWIARLDLYRLRFTHEVRAGIHTRNLAVSHEGRYVLVGNTLPKTLVLLDAKDLAPLQVIQAPSRISAVYQAAPRKSFIVALKDVPEVWEVDASPPFSIRRLKIQATLDDFFFDPDYRYLIGADREKEKAVVVDLDLGRVVASLDLPGMPHLGSGITWMYQGHRVFATPHLKDGVVSVIDMEDWHLVKRIPTLGPGFFLRSHEHTPYAWVDVFFGPHKDAIQVIDKHTLEVVRTLHPEPGKTSAHVEFTKDGRYALVSIWEDEGAVVVYDAKTFEEVKRLSMRKPSGKYNVYNKIQRSEGTSH